jgi:hypothetical protein
VELSSDALQPRLGSIVPRVLLSKFCNTLEEPDAAPLPILVKPVGPPLRSQIPPPTDAGLLLAIFVKVPGQQRLR